MGETSLKGVHEEFAHTPRIEMETEIAQLRNRLAQIERQVIYRTADMPEWADKWMKNEHGAWFCGLTRSGHAYGAPAPDYRPDEPGRLWLPIINPESTQGALADRIDKHFGEWDG